MSAAPNQLLATLYSNPGGAVEETKQASAPVSADVEKQAQANLQEADFLGRVMAHSFWQEVGTLKEASVGDGQTKEAAAVTQRLIEVIDHEAEKVAANLLHVNGVNPLTMKPYQTEVEKTSAVQDFNQRIAQKDIEMAIEKRAMEMLSAYGYELQA